jgi:hypothetical protein
MDTIQSAFSSARFSRLLLAFGALVLAAGVALVIIRLAGGSDNTQTNPAPSFRPILPAKAHPLVNGAGVRVTNYGQLDQESKQAIRTFIAGAVGGKNYAAAWKYVTPRMRGGYTYKQWVTSNSHPFVPFPVYKPDTTTNYSLVYAHRNDVMVEVGLTPAPKSKLRPTVFWIELKKVGTRTTPWLVDYWMPRWTPEVPQGGS